MVSPPATSMDWDAWREAYPSLTYRQQQDFYSEVYEKHPVQRHFNAKLARKALLEVQPGTVTELGGWDGELAGRMLEEFPSIYDWLNIEICREAAEAGIGRHPNYVAVSLDRWYWETDGKWHTDLFVASHTIEHLTAHDLEQTIAKTVAKGLYFDAPLNDEPTSWEGYYGTHILGMGWNGVDELCERYGYSLSWRVPHATGKACLYLR